LREFSSRVAVWRAVLLYLGVATALHLIWEMAQLPLYTIWRTGTRFEILFAIIHCTAGDLLITACALTLAALIARIERWPFFGKRMMLTVILLGLCYTVFSEWLNTQVRQSWSLHRGDAAPAATRHGSHPLFAMADRAGYRPRLRQAKSQGL